MTQRRLVSALFSLALIVGLGYLLLRGVERSPGVDPASFGGAVARSVDELDAFTASDPAPSPVADVARRVATPSPDPELEAATEARPDATLIVGRVVDEAGNPIEGAAVRALRSLEHLIAEEHAGFDGIAGVTTDAGGSFRITLKRAGETCLGVRAAGYAPADVEGIVAVPAAETALMDAVVLERSARLTGVVLDETRTPIENARVIQRERETLTTRHHRPETGGVRTGPDGRFEFDQVPRRTVTLDVSHAEYATHRQAVEPGEPGQTLDVSILLERGAAIVGRVEGVPSDMQEPLSVVARPREFQIDQAVRSAAVDPDGSFRLRGLPVDSSWRVLVRRDRADHNWMENVKASVSAVADAEAGERALVIEWQSASTLRFQVLDASSREPLDDLAVMFGSGWNVNTRIRPSSASGFEGGNVLIENLRPDPEGRPFTLDIDAIGYERWTRDDILVVAGRDLDLGTIELKPTPRMTITVLDDRDDTPVERAVVRWALVEPEIPAAVDAGSSVRASLERQSSSQSRGRMTDELGRAEFDGAAGSTVGVVIRKSGFAEAGIGEWQLPAGDDAERIVRLVPGGAVLVSARNALGQALSGRSIEHRAPATDWDFVAPAATSREVARVTDADGRVLFEDLNEGEHAFRIASANDGATRPAAGVFGEAEVEQEESWPTVEVVSGRTNELVLIEAPRASLTGIITERGQPLEQATVWLSKLSEREPSRPDYLRSMRVLSHGGVKSRTDRDGRFLVDGLEPGDYLLRIEHHVRAMSFELELTLGAGETRRDIEVGLAIVRGRVVDSSGAGVADVAVSVQSADWPRASPDFSFLGGVTYEPNDACATITDMNGAYELRGVATGVELVVLADGESVGWQFAVSDPLPAAVEGLLEVDIEVQRAGSLDFRVQNQDGSKPASVHLELWRTSDGEGVEPEQDFLAFGTGKVEGLAPGAWRVRARDPNSDTGEAGVERSIEVVAGETTPIEMVLP